MNENMNNEELEYDLDKFDEANDRANKLFEARMKQFELFQKGVTDGETDID